MANMNWDFERTLILLEENLKLVRYEGTLTGEREDRLRALVAELRLISACSAQDVAA